jgi:aminoglycoside phosphotransferase (APT) family kinase protein
MIMTEMATILLKIHQIRVDEMENIDLPKYDFLFYFFPGVSDHADLFQVLTSLLHHTPIKPECLIHGDFHLHNLVEDHGRCTVIDWTNGQLGDPRFDYAWSLTLMRIYISDRYAQVFRSAYLAENTIPQEELDVFEAIACLRWLLLNRSGGVPRNTRTMKKVKNLMLSNRFLAFSTVELL